VSGAVLLNTCELITAVVAPADLVNERANLASAYHAVRLAFGDGRRSVAPGAGCLQCGVEDQRVVSGEPGEASFDLVGCEGADLVEAVAGSDTRHWEDCCHGQSSMSVDGLISGPPQALQRLGGPLNEATRAYRNYVRISIRDDVSAAQPVVRRHAGSNSRDVEIHLYV
jgi:hypothetical protein